MQMGKVFAVMLLAMLALAMLESTQVVAGPPEAQYQISKARSRYGPGSLKSFQCPLQCSRRCQKSDHHKKACLFFCNKCCTKCLCVPPGFVGNKQVCPCYNNWKTKQGGPKCP